MRRTTVRRPAARSSSARRTCATRSRHLEPENPLHQPKQPNPRPQPADPRDDLDAELGTSPAAPLASADRRHRHYVSRVIPNADTTSGARAISGHQLRRRKASAQLVCLY